MEKFSRGIFSVIADVVCSYKEARTYHIVLSAVSRVRCPVCGVSLLSHVSVVPCFHVLTTRPRHPDSDKPCFFCDGLKKC